MDNLAVPSRTPHQDLAEKFINYMYLLDPDVAVRFCAFNYCGTPNKAARELIPEADRNNPAIYPTAETLARLWYGEDLGDKQKLYDELWTQIKAK